MRLEILTKIDNNVQILIRLNQESVAPLFLVWYKTCNLKRNVQLTKKNIYIYTNKSGLYIYLYCVYFVQNKIKILKKRSLEMLVKSSASSPHLYFS